MSYDDRYKEARKRVKKKKEFYRNLFSWLLTSIFLFIINLMTSPRFLWALFPFVGWGIGIAFHAFEIFGYPGMGSDWEERQVEEEMRRIERMGLRSGPPESEDRLDLPELKKKDSDQPYEDEDLV
jgi:hypothetical protein